MPSFPASPKCIVWIPFGLIDYCIWFGSSKASLNGSYSSPVFASVTSCDLVVKGSDAETVSWPSFICLFNNPSLKRVLSRGLNLIILYGSRQGEIESVKNISACDWSNLVSRLTRKISRAIFSLAIDSNLSGCLKEAVCLSDRPVWPREIFIFHFLGPNGGPVDL